MKLRNTRGFPEIPRNKIITLGDVCDIEGRYSATRTIYPKLVKIDAIKYKVSCTYYGAVRLGNSWKLRSTREFPEIPGNQIIFRDVCDIENCCFSASRKFFPRLHKNLLSVSNGMESDNKERGLEANESKPNNKFVKFITCDKNREIQTLKRNVT